MFTCSIIMRKGCVTPFYAQVPFSWYGPWDKFWNTYENKKKYDQKLYFCYFIQNWQKLCLIFLIKTSIICNRLKTVSDIRSSMLKNSFKCWKFKILFSLLSLIHIWVRYSQRNALKAVSCTLGPMIFDPTNQISADIFSWTWQPCPLSTFFSSSVN